MVQNIEKDGRFPKFIYTAKLTLEKKETIKCNCIAIIDVKVMNNQWE